MQGIFFSVCLSFLFTVTNRNEAIIVRGIKNIICFEWHFYHLFRGSPSFLAITIIFLRRCHFFNFCKKMQKMKIDYVHCPMRKFWRTSLRTMWESLRIQIPGEGCTSFVCRPYAPSWGTPRVKMEVL